MDLIQIAVLTAIFAPVVALAAVIGISKWRRAPTRIPRWPDLTVLGRLTIAVGLIAVVSGMTITTILFLGQSSSSDKFTEFYLLGVDGTADGYPAALSVGEPASLTLGIVNQEGRETDYSIALFINGTLADRVTAVRLKPREQWQRPLTFTLTEGGENQLMEFVLYRDRRSQPYRTLRLWVDGVGPLATPEAIESVLAEAEAPTPTPTPTPTPAPQYEVHIVSRGENLSVISRRYGAPLKTVIEANASEIPDPNLIYSNQRIRIPLEAR